MPTPLNPSQTPSEIESKPRPWLKIGIATALLAATMILGRGAGAYIPQFTAWVDGLGAWGPIAFVFGYVVATLAFVPGSLLTLAAGAIFGLLEGTLYVFFAATLGATLAFLVARHAAREAIEKRIAGDARFAAIDRAVATEGRKIVLLLRLSPVFPFNLLNYALGLTRVRLLDYCVGSIGMLPGTLLYVYAGRVIGDVAAVAGGAGPERGLASWVLIGIGLVATLVVTIIVTRIARRALDEATGDGELA